MDPYHWILTTDDYAFQDKLWNTNFFLTGVYDNSDQALKAGQKYFNTQIAVSQPQVVEENGERTCIYNQGDALALYARNLTVN